MKGIIFTNAFHETEVVLDLPVISDSENRRVCVVHPRQIANLQQRLCGNNDCPCGGAFGQHGIQPDNSDGWYVLSCYVLSDDAADIVYGPGEGRVILYKSSSESL